jgi:methyl-accepting chemotaxis protein
MKNEPGRRADRIVELLAESLKRQDQMVEQIGSMNENIGSMNQKIESLGSRMDRVENGIGRVVASVDALTDIVKSWTLTA